MSEAAARRHVLTLPERARAKFLRHFPGGFRDETYLEWEREYKLDVHRAWNEVLAPREYRHLLDASEHAEIARRALRVEQGARHSMLFSFEKMALRDAVRTEAGARRFAEALDVLLHGHGPMQARWLAWRDALESMPRRGRRVASWPVVTVFPFIARPRRHIFVKPRTIRRAADLYGHDLPYSSRPEWETYASLLELARRVKRDQAGLGPRDMVDVQSFLWVLGSDEYA